MILSLMELIQNELMKIFNWTWAYRNSNIGMFKNYNTSKITNVNEIPNDWK